MTAERNLGPAVTAAGFGTNLALGILYAWSVLKGRLSGQDSRQGTFQGQ